MDINTLTPEQRAELKAQLVAEEQAENQRRLSERENYKSMVDGFVRVNVVKLQILSDQMAEIKADVFADADVLIELKDELFKTKPDRRSNSFTTTDGRMTLTMGTRTNK